MKIDFSQAEEQLGQFACRCKAVASGLHTRGIHGCIWHGEGEPNQTAQPTAEEIGVKQAFERTGAGSPPNQLGPTSCEVPQTVVSDSESAAALNMARVLKECVEEIRAEIDGRYTHAMLQWECNQKRKERDMEIVHRAHDAVWRFQKFRTERV